MSNSLKVINHVVQDAEGQPLANAQIAILAGTINGASPVNTTTQPGSPLATIYADPQGQTQLTNPTTPGTATITTDGLGNICSFVNGVYTIGVWVNTSGYGASPYFVLQVYGAGIVQQLVPYSF